MVVFGPSCALKHLFGRLDLTSSSCDHAEREALQRRRGNAVQDGHPGQRVQAQQEGWDVRDGQQQDREVAVACVDDRLALPPLAVLPFLLFGGISLGRGEQGHTEQQRGRGKQRQRRWLPTTTATTTTAA